MKMFFKKIFLCCLCSIFLPLQSGVWAHASSVSACLIAFNKEEIQSFFAHPENIRKYSGQTGYLHFAEQTKLKNMSSVFQKVSRVLGEDFTHLKWQAFLGSTKEFRKLNSLVLNENGQFKEKYRTMEGYARLAKKHFNGNMFKAFINVSAVLDKNIFKQAGWQHFLGSTKEFRKLKRLVLNENGQFKEEYRTMNGYARLAEKHFNGNMFKAFINVSAVLDKNIFEQAGWKKFNGSTKEFRELNSLVLNENGLFKEEYRTMNGYARLAEEHFNGNMKKTFMNVSAVFGGFRNIKELGWKKFNGTTAEYYQLVALFKNTPFEDLQGSHGQEKVAKQIFKNHALRTYNNVSALKEILFVSPEEFKLLGWSRHTRSF